MGINLIYCRPYEPEGKGKLERFHRTFRNQFLTEIDLNNISGFDDLNTRLWIWLEKIYHRNPHSSLGKTVTPIERFQRDLLKIKPLGQFAEKLDSYFYHRAERSIKKDGTLSYGGNLFEVPFDLVGQSVYLVVDPYKKQPKWIESLGYEYLGEVHPLDKITNNNRSRLRPGKNNADELVELAPKTSIIDLAYEKELKALELTQSNNKF